MFEKTHNPKSYPNNLIKLKKIQLPQVCVMCDYGLIKKSHPQKTKTSTALQKQQNQDNFPKGFRRDIFPMRCKQLRTHQAAGTENQNPKPNKTKKTKKTKNPLIVTRPKPNPNPLQKHKNCSLKTQKTTLISKTSKKTYQQHTTHKLKRQGRLKITLPLNENQKHIESWP